MAAVLTPRERIERTLDFREVDVAATGEIIQNGDLISLFAGRRVREDWTLAELAATYRGLEIDLGMLLAPASVPRAWARNGITKWRGWKRWMAPAILSTSVTSTPGGGGMSNGLSVMSAMLTAPPMTMPARTARTLRSRVGTRDCATGLAV